MNHRSALPLIAAVVIAACIVVVMSVPVTASRESECPHNTCVQGCSECPPTGWYCFGYCPCEPNGASFGFCFDCVTYQNWNGSYIAYHDEWYDDWDQDSQCDYSLGPCVTFDMKICDVD
jgi:hypothetical protein